MAKPQRHLFVCTQARPQGHPRGSCAERGCAQVAEEFWFQLQGRNLLGPVALTTTGCIGPCGVGPNVLVYPEGVMYSGVTREDVAAIVESHVVEGVPVERLLAPAEVWS